MLGDVINGVIGPVFDATWNAMTYVKNISYK